jgi:hypothetical protein
MGKTLGKIMRMRKCWDDNIKIKPIGETGSGSCPMAGFGISGVEPWGSARVKPVGEPSYFVAS